MHTFISKTARLKYVGWPYDGCEKEPDDDPMDQIGHGTHVAGIVAGKSDTGFVGVAPDATILSYKVFTSIVSYKFSPIIWDRV